MKRYIFPSFFSVVLSLTFALAAYAQGSTFSDKNVEYSFDLPEALWKMTVKPTAATPSVEYVYGDRLDGHLEIKKMAVKADETLSDVILRDREQKLQLKPGFVAGKEENFSGTFTGKVSNYEYVQSGKTMSGRFYYLRADDTTIYVLRFTGLRDQLRGIRNQTDSIARTFKVKAS
jgi:hypothetical protein